MRPKGRFVCCLIALTACVATVPDLVAQNPNTAAQGIATQGIATQGTATQGAVPQGAGTQGTITQGSGIGYPAPTIHSSGQRATAVPLPALPSANGPAHPSNAAWVAGPGSPNQISPANGTLANGTQASVAQASYTVPTANSLPAQTTNATQASADTVLTKRTPLNSKKLDTSVAEGKRSSSNTLQMLFSVGSSLLIVIGLFLGVAWCYRKTLNTTMGGIPKQVVSVLGRTAIAPRQQLVLVRFGSKMVLISLNQGETRTISEITDPIEVDQLAGACESHQPHSLTNSFRAILNQGGGAM